MDSYSPLPLTEVIAPRSSGSNVTPAPIMQLICHCEIPVTNAATVCCSAVDAGRGTPAPVSDRCVSCWWCFCGCCQSPVQAVKTPHLLRFSLPKPSPPICFHSFRDPALSRMMWLDLSMSVPGIEGTGQCGHRCHPSEVQVQRSIL